MHSLQATVAASIGIMIVNVAGGRGVDVERLCSQTGFDPRRAADPEARIGIQLESELWEHAAAMSGDAHFGLHAAQALRPGILDVLDYAVRTASTLREALDRLARYNPLAHDTAMFTLVELGEVFRVEHGTSGVAQSRHAAEFTLASLVVVGSQLAGKPIRALSVGFRHAAPSDTEPREYEELFGTLPTFGEPNNRIEFDAETMRRRVVAHDPALSRLMERQAEALLSGRPAYQAPTAERVANLLVTSLSQEPHNATLASMARRLNTSERSLQRRLAEEGTSFNELLDGVRRDLAERHVANPRLSIAEMAYLLGYSEPSAFCRAFRRWTGMTPNQVRQGAARAGFLSVNGILSHGKTLSRPVDGRSRQHPRNGLVH